MVVRHININIPESYPKWEEEIRNVTYDVEDFVYSDENCVCHECVQDHLDAEPLDDIFELPIDIVKVGIWINHRLETHHHAYLLGKVTYPIHVQIL